jgi:hypothetical protein
MIASDPWFWKLSFKFSIRSLRSRIPQLLKVSITNTSIVKGASGQAWKATLRSLMMPRVNLLVCLVVIYSSLIGA